MKNIHRARTEKILGDLERKMVFIVGPRQVGKTHLARQIARKFTDVVYLNYDNVDHRQIIRQMHWKQNADLLILDELHKMPDWKNFLKGVYDTKPEKMRILVTGSARLETYRKVADSLAGRFFLHHLLPLSLDELRQAGLSTDIDHLLRRGGFPELFLAADDTEADRWRENYIDSLLRDDIFSLRKVADIYLMENIFDILRHRVGSPISYSAIARDCATSPTTVKRYLEILESLYIVFSLRPYSRKITRSILKERKIYFFDTPLVSNGPGATFENFLAVSLLKHCLMEKDLSGKRCELMYLRDKEKREVDFALVSDGKVREIIESKLSEKTPTRALRYFHRKYGFPARQVVKNLPAEREIDGIVVSRAQEYLENLT